MTSGNRDAKKLARKLMLGEASWGKEPMPKTVNYTQALVRANALLLEHEAVKAQVIEDWKPVTFKDIRQEARELEKTEGIRYMEAIGRVEQGLRDAMPEAHKELANAWESFLEHNVLHYKTLTNRGEFGPWLKVRETRLESNPEVTAIQMYIETLSGELHLSNVWTHGEPALFNLPGDGLLRFVQKSEFGGLLETSVAVASTTDIEVFSKRFTGMFDIVTREMDMDGKRKLSDVIETVPRSSIEDTNTWEDFYKKYLVRIGMYYGHGTVSGKGIYDARYTTYNDDGIGKKIYVTRSNLNTARGYEQSLGELGTEDLIVWVPVGDGSYKDTMPIIAGTLTPHEFANQLIDLLMDVQEHGVAMAFTGDRQN